MILAYVCVIDGRLAIVRQCLRDVVVVSGFLLVVDWLLRFVFCLRVVVVDVCWCWGR